MKQKYSQAEKAAGKHFNVKELSTNRTASKSEQIPNEMRTPSNKDYGSLVGLSTQQWKPKTTKRSCDQQKFWVNTGKASLYTWKRRKLKIILGPFQVTFTWWLR